MKMKFLFKKKNAKNSQFNYFHTLLFLPNNNIIPIYSIYLTPNFTQIFYKHCTISLGCVEIFTCFELIYDYYYNNITREINCF